MTIEREPKRMCVERVIPWNLQGEANALAVLENPANWRTPSSPGVDSGGSMNHRLALVKGKMWANGRTLRVGFLDGTPLLRQKVQQYANEWTKYANLRFDFGGVVDPEIRVSFAFDPGRSWSAVGTDVLVERYFPAHQPTMNFGWFTDDTPEAELSRVIVHEFGHAIGCIHEHQNPVDGIDWDEAAVIKYFSGPPNYWSEATIRFNILDKYTEHQLNGSTFDLDSIMLYAFPASLTHNQVDTHENNKLSEGDIAFIHKAYPRPAQEA